MPATVKTKILILGASDNPARFSYIAANALANKGYDIVPIGLRSGVVAGKPILDIRTRPRIDHVDTITLYMNPGNQSAYLEYILGMDPRRIIFNPGTENSVLIDMAEKQKVEVIVDCTLVMLRSGYF